MRVQPFERTDLHWLLELVNVHLSAVIPGWALTETFLAEYMEHNYCEYVTDPWVEERVTLCAVEGHRVLAVVHLMRYGTGPEVSDSYRGAGEINWFLFLPGRDDAATGVLSAARERLAAWEVGREYGWGGGVPAGPPMLGIPDAWPHIAEVLEAAGYRQHAERSREALYAGSLDSVPEPEETPMPGLMIRRTAGDDGTRFAAILGGEEIGRCECRQDLAHGGALPALRGWADLWELQVRESWRNRGVGSWLARHAVAWLKLSGCNRIVINVTEDDETAGADRFYRRFGWEVFTREVFSGSIERPHEAD